MLENYVNHKTINDAETLCSKRMGHKSMLPEELESALAENCVIMKERFYGLRSTDIRRMAFQLVLKTNLSHPFSQQKGAGGKKWFKNFLWHHPSLSFRKPQAVSGARVKGFCRENVKEFLNMLFQELISLHQKFIMLTKWD
jgi:hypothetical protein